MILTKEVKVIPIGKAIKHYREKGYDANYKQPLIVKVEDLMDGSGEEIEVLCDFCKKNKVKIMYKDYRKRIEKYGNSVCEDCKPLKTKENNLRKYGVESTSSLLKVKEKVKATNIEKYGFPCSLQNKEVREKAIKTCNLHYGVDYSIQSEEIYIKTRESLYNHYGVENPSQSIEIKEKISQTFYQNDTQKVSKQQYYINNLYQGILNFPVKRYNVDIYLPNDNLIIEYDGGGHMLNVITGRETTEEFDQKEIIRNNIIKREGYKQMRIVSRKDLLPSDYTLLQLLLEAKEYFSKTNHSWCTYDIDNSLLINAEHKDGILYSYGELRTIKENDLSEQHSA